MAYWKSKSELELIYLFGDNVVAFIKARNQLYEWGYRGSYRSPEDPTVRDIERALQEARFVITSNVQEVDLIAARHNILYMLAVRAPVGATHHNQDISVFRAMLMEDDLIQRALQPQAVTDTLNSLVAACQRQVRKDRNRLFNPFYWIGQGLLFIIRIPFLLLQAAGFHIEKFEDELWGRLFKLATIITILYFIHLWGIKPEQWVQELIKTFAK